MKSFLTILLLCGCVVLLSACTEQAVPSVEITELACAMEADRVYAPLTTAEPLPAKHRTDEAAQQTPVIPEEPEVLPITQADYVPETAASKKTTAQQDREPVQQENDDAHAETTFIIPASPQSSVAWSTAPEQQTSAPYPVINPGFVITCPLEPTAAPTPQPAQPPAPEPVPGASSVVWQPKPASTPTVTPEPIPGPIVTPEPAAPEPTPDPATPEPSPAPEPDATHSPNSGYAVCTCGATLLPEELVPHMKAHALAGESHSYSAY